MSLLTMSTDLPVSMGQDLELGEHVFEGDPWTNLESGLSTAGNDHAEAVPLIDARQSPAWPEFQRLRDEWMQERGPLSLMSCIAVHPAYQAIVGMGENAVPLMLHELRTAPEHWFWALEAITRADPVAERDRGDMEAMTEAWLGWGRDRGLIAE